MKIKWIFFIIVLLTFSGCRFSSYSSDCDGDLVDAQFYFYVESSDSVDLLNPANSGAYTEDSIKIYYKQSDGTYKYFYHKMVDISKGFRIFENTRYLMAVVLSEDIPSEYYTSLIIQWNESDKDTIDTKFLFDNDTENDASYSGYCSASVWDSIWINHQLIASDWKTYYQNFTDYPVIIKSGDQ